MVTAIKRAGKLLRSVKRGEAAESTTFAETKAYGKVDVLVNNAGV
jgi:NADP-dependent 3-hydroxy acid dehydrogenase YdfG